MKFLYDYHKTRTLISFEPSNSFEGDMWLSLDKSNNKFYRFYIKDFTSHTLKEAIFFCENFVFNENFQNNIVAHCYAGFARTGIFIFMYIFFNTLFKNLQLYLKSKNELDKKNYEDIIKILFSGDLDKLSFILNNLYPNYFTFDTNGTQTEEVFNSSNEHNIILRNHRLNAIYLASLYWIEIYYYDNKEIEELMKKFPVILSVYNFKDGDQIIELTCSKLYEAIEDIGFLFTESQFTINDIVNISNSSQFLDETKLEYRFSEDNKTLITYYLNILQSYELTGGSKNKYIARKIKKTKKNKILHKNKKTHRK